MSSSIDRADAAQQETSRCLAEHLDGIEAEYLAANAATGTERERRYKALIDCLSDAGVSGVASGMAEGDIGQMIYDQLAEEKREPAFRCMSDNITLFS